MNFNRLGQAGFKEGPRERRLESLIGSECSRLHYVKLNCGSNWGRVGVLVRLMLALGLVGGKVLASPAPQNLVPEDGNTYDFYVANQELYDSNLYRLSTVIGSLDTPVTPNATRHDLVNSSTVGADGQLTLGRQLFNANVHLDENLFVHNTQLDNLSGYGNFLWNWLLGSHLSGEAGVTYTHGLATFAETRFLGRDMVDTVQYNASGRYSIGPRWAVYGGVGDSNAVHHAREALFNNFHTKTGVVGGQFVAGLKDTVSVEYRYTDAGFPPGDLYTLNNVFFSPNYHESLVRGLFSYTISDKTQISGDYGYLKRQYPNTSIGEFAGNIYRLTFNWQPTEKTSVLVSAWHELHAYLNSESDYFVSKGINVSPVWLATEKFSVAVVLAHENQDYIPQSLNVLNGGGPVLTPVGPQAGPLIGPLNAKLTTEQLKLRYTPKSHWIFDLSYIHTSRTSNQATFAYNDDLATVSVLYKIH